MPRQQAADHVIAWLHTLASPPSAHVDPDRPARESGAVEPPGHWRRGGDDIAVLLAELAEVSALLIPPRSPGTE